MAVRRGGRGHRGHAALQEGPQGRPQVLEHARQLPQSCGHCRVHVPHCGHRTRQVGAACHSPSVLLAGSGNSQLPATMHDASDVHHVLQFCFSTCESTAASLSCAHGACNVMLMTCQTHDAGCRSGGQTAKHARSRPCSQTGRCRFTHGRPDVQLLCDYCHNKFGWPLDKTGELLQPVLKACLPCLWT